MTTKTNAKFAAAAAAKIAFDAAQKAFEAAPNSLAAKVARDRALAALTAARR
jgi:hypothetical protein